MLLRRRDELPQALLKPHHFASTRTLGSSLGGCRVRNLKANLHIQVAERRAGRFVISIDCVRPVRTPFPNSQPRPNITNRAATKHTRLRALHLSCVPGSDLSGKRGGRE